MRNLPNRASLRPFSASLAILGLAVLPGCKLELCADPNALTPSSNGTSKQPIVGGTVDRENRSTVALLVTPTAGQNAVCSGTVIARDGDRGYVLTAAHCVTGVVHHIFEATDWRDCVSGGNPAGCAASYAATAWMPHPSYDPTTLANDFGIIEFSGATDQTAVTPAVSGPDGLAVPETLMLSGYGRTYAGPDNPNLFQSLRHDVDAQIASLDETRFTFDATTGKTACFGDSGSGAYAITASGARAVVGVASSADQFCEKVSIYGRVSRVYSSFIAPVIAAPPSTAPPAPQANCASCIGARFDGNASCAGALADCQGASECDAILTCVKACVTTDSACFADCEAPHAGGLGMFEHVASCTACSVCDQECGGTSCGWSSQPPSGSTSSSTSSWNPAGSSGPGSGGGVSQNGVGGGATASPPNGSGTSDSASCIPATLSCSVTAPDGSSRNTLLGLMCIAAAVTCRRRSGRTPDLK